MLINQFDSRIKVIQAMNGEEAVDKVVAAERPFHNIFLDLHMPVLDGFKVGDPRIMYYYRLLSSSEATIERKRSTYQTHRSSRFQQLQRTSS